MRACNREASLSLMRTSASSARPSVTSLRSNGIGTASSSPRINTSAGRRLACASAILFAVVLNSVPPELGSLLVSIVGRLSRAAFSIFIRASGILSRRFVAQQQFDLQLNAQENPALSVGNGRHYNSSQRFEINPRWATEAQSYQWDA